MASVHRATYLDYVGVKSFGARGEVSGEHRFLGLWTSTAYQLSPREIPVLRKKVERVIGHFALDPQSHDAKAALHVLDTYPRDELFQAPIADLIRIARGVVNLYERRTVRLLARRDPWQRFYSLLIYVPRDRYSTLVRQRIRQIIARRFRQHQHRKLGFKYPTPIMRACTSSCAPIRMTGAKWILRLSKGASLRRRRRGLTDCVPWGSRSTTRRQCSRSRIATGTRFPLAYEEDVAPADASGILRIWRRCALIPARRASACTARRVSIPERVHLKIVKLGDPVPISDLLPMLENFGLRVGAERPYELVWPEGGGSAWIQDFELEHLDALRIDIARIEATFKGGVRGGVARRDRRMTASTACYPTTGLAAREIVVNSARIAACCGPACRSAEAYMERTLAAKARIAKVPGAPVSEVFRAALRARAATL